MTRLNIERQNKLEPKRIDVAKNEIQKLGYEIIFENNTEIQFRFKDKTVHYFPYSGWHTGASIIDGRGFKHLLQQIG